MTNLFLGIILGIIFGIVATVPMLRMTFSDKRYTKSKPITIKEVTTGNIRDFPNILAVVSYLDGINNKINRNTITKYLNTGKPIKGYYFYEK